MKKILLAALLTCLTFPVQAAMEDYPSVEIKALDKSTARTSQMEVKVGETFQFGSLYIKVQACRQSSPMETPESAAFLQIWEVPPEQSESQWVFSGWMFASSPALSAMDHPVYDVWVLACTGKIPSAGSNQDAENKEQPTDNTENSGSEAAQED